MSWPSLRTTKETIKSTTGREFEFRTPEILKATSRDSRELNKLSRSTDKETDNQREYEE